MTIRNLIGSTYQVVDDNNTVWFQGAYDECARYIYHYKSPSKQLTIDELTERVGILELEIQWTRDMMDILRDMIDEIKSSGHTK